MKNLINTIIYPIKMKQLFKKDSKNKIRIWKIYTQGAELIQESGLEAGKLVKHSKICIKKNVGKSNETTSEQQALSELESSYKDKLTEGYFETKELAESEEVILPTLAKSYNDHKNKIDWNNTYVQRKFDGMRCLAIIEGDYITLKSRDGKVIENMEHIIDELSIGSFKTKDLVLDGELWMEGSFQDNMKAIKKKRPGVTEKIQFNVYDIVSDDEFQIRNQQITTILLDNKFKNTVVVETYKIFNEIALKDYHKQFISEGFEGTMVRTGTSGYPINKRSDSLLKYKDFKDMDLEILDITPAEQRPEQGVPHFELNGKSFKSGVRMSHEDREDLLINKSKYIGKIANIRYFELTDDGIPRFPIMIGIHVDR